MNEKLVELYRKHRSKGYPAYSALAEARFSLEVEKLNLRWLDLPRRRRIALWREEGFLVVVVVSDDEDPCCYGSFTNNWTPGALKLCKEGGRTFPFYIPEVSEDEHCEGLKEFKWGKTAAREAAHRYVLEDLAYAIGDKPLYYLSAHVFLSGQKPEEVSLLDGCLLLIEGEEVASFATRNCGEGDENLVATAREAVLMAKQAVAGE